MNILRSWTRLAWVVRSGKPPDREASIRGADAALCARELGVDEHHVVKTLVMQDEAAKPLIVLMHGDCKVSTKNLARQIGAKSVEPCKPEVANRHSGYLVGGTSPLILALEYSSSVTYNNSITLVKGAKMITFRAASSITSRRTARRGAQSTR